MIQSASRVNETPQLHETLTASQVTSGCLSYHDLA